MTYGTTSDVKTRCEIEQDNDKYVDLIKRALDYADDMIDSLFKSAAAAVPTPTPPMIAEAASDIAAYFIIRPRNMELAEKYLTAGVNAVNLYISANVTGQTGGAQRVSTPQVSSNKGDD